MAIQVTVMSLDFESFEQPVTRVFEKGEITLGRHQTNDLVLDRPEVSGIHARLRVKNGDGSPPALYVTDLGSANGTMVENSALKAQVEVAILPNQRLIVGTYLIKPSIVAETLTGKRPKGKGAAAEAERSESLSSGLRESTFSPETRGRTVLFKRPEISGAELDAAEAASSDAAPGASVEASASDPVTESEAVHEMHDQNGSALHSSAGPIDDLHAEETGPADEGYASPVSNSSPADTLFATPEDHGPAADAEGLSSFIVFVDGSSFDNLDFVARELFDVGGTVTHKGEPLAGVRVDGGALGERTTGSDGAFEFADVPEGTEYSFRVEKKGFLFDLAGSGAGSVAEDLSLKFEATQLFDVRGSVTHRGRPLAGVEVDGGSLGTQTTDDRGSFAFVDVPEGTAYSLALKKQKFVFDKATVSGDSGPNDQARTFTARELFALRGRVIHRGQPMAGVEVDGGELGKVVTGEDGSYVFENVPEGAKYILTASRDGFVFGTIKGKSGS